MTEQEIWEKLYADQFTNVTTNANKDWVNGMFKLGLHKLPLVEDIAIPHWKILPILGKSPEPIFWYRLSRGIFNVNMRLREVSELAYLSERDYFHDVFGHTPMLHNKAYTDFVKGLGLFAQYVSYNPNALKAISNFYWVFPEFGLIEEGSNVKVLGAGILSSVAELKYSVGPDSRKIVFENKDLDDIAEMKDYVLDGFQTQYYILQSWDQLRDILKYLWNRYV